MDVGDCVVCRDNAAAESLPPRERVYIGDGWRVAHAWSALPGWLVVAPLRHVVRLSELERGEADALGPLLRAASTALETVTGGVKTYVMLFAEAEGFAHVHFHVVPRMADFGPDDVGPRVMKFIAAPEDEWLPEAERDRLALAIRDELVRALSS